MKLTTAVTNEAATAAVARKPAPRLPIRLPASAIASAAPSGVNRQIQAATINRAGS
jgi:hypothetical protein